MRKQAFGDRQVSVIGLGSGNFGGKTAENQARQFMDAYAAMGGNLIDTGRVYGDYVTPRSGESEKIIGRWLSDRRCRKDIFLSTKGGHPPLTANQIQFSLARPVHCYDPTLAAMDGKAWKMHRQTGMICCCFTSQARGFFTKLDASGWDQLPENLKNDYGCEENLHILEKLRALRGETGFSVGASGVSDVSALPHVCPGGRQPDGARAGIEGSGGRRALPTPAGRASRV